MAFCAQMCQKLCDLCRPCQSDDTDEMTRLTVKCQNRYVSDENLLQEASLPAVHRPSLSPGSGSEADLTLSCAGLSASDTRLDRVQPPAERLYRPDLDGSQLSLNEFGSEPDVTGAATGAPRTFVSRKLRPEVMRHAQTIADISKFTLRDLKTRNRSGDAGARPPERASRLGFDRAQYESSGSLTRDAAPPVAAGAADDAKVVDEVYGTVSVTVSFNPHLKRLLLRLEAVHNLPARGEGRVYDAATEVTLLPDGKPVRRAPVQPGELNPRYNVDWTLPLRAKDVRHKTLRVSVLDAARRGPYDAVGHALLPLQGTVGESPDRYVMPLSRRSVPTEPLGRLLVSLSYRPADDRLSVVVMQARELRAAPAAHHLPPKTFEKHARYDTFVKASLRCAGEKVKTKRSPVLAGSRDPFYNAGFGFVLPQGFVDDASLVVSVVMRGPLRTDLVIGRVILGPYFSHAGGQPTQWGRALTTSEVATQWHRLYL